jgi:Domain of unknown function (DUF4268)
MLELVVKPNDWEKQAIAATSATPTQEKYRQFRGQIEPHLKERGWTHATAPPQSWWTLSAGATGVSWTLSFTKFGCRSELIFEHKDAAVNALRWQELYRRKAEIEKTFGPGLIFEELPKKKACRIEVRLNGPKVADADRWPEVITWMLDTQARLRDAIQAVGGVPTTVAGPEPQL